MTSGLACDDSSGGGETNCRPHAQSRDWVRHILGRRLDTTPGEWAYSSASSHLLSAIVADATGQSPLAFARAKLFGPARHRRRRRPGADGPPLATAPGRVGGL